MILDTIIAVDVLIIGAGNAGLRAAIAAAQNGAKTMIISKSPFPGGSSVVSGGLIEASFGEGDSEELHFRETVESGAYLGNQRLTQILVSEIKDRVFDLEDYGVVFLREGPSTFKLVSNGGTSVPRSLTSGRNDRVQRCLYDRARSLGVTLYQEFMPLKIFLDEAKRPVGVAAYDIQRGERFFFQAGAVVMASGGCAGLFKRRATPRNTAGDGFGLALDLGVRLVDMEFVQFIPLSFVYGFIEGMTLGEGDSYGDKVRLRNALGERYMERYSPEHLEHSTRDVVARSNYLEIRAGRGTPRGAILIDATESDPRKAYFQPHHMAHRYRLIVDFYGKDKADLKEPLEAAPSALYICGGIEINERCETNLPGLFACGEVIGNVHGANRLGGNSLADVQVFGKRAGEQAAIFSRESSLKSPNLHEVEGEFLRLRDLCDSKGSVTPRSIKRELQQLMWDHMGIVRDASRLSEGLQKLENLKDKGSQMGRIGSSRRYNYALLEAIEVPSMLCVAEVMLRSGLFREESRGNHFRSDFPESRETWHCHTIAEKRGGEILLSRKEIERI
jgi:succinate dehydrogenase/fumarate reductase flavoprotein subunit